MARSILVPHDGSEHAQKALQYALESFPDARIVLFHAIDPFEVTPNAEEGRPPLTEEWLERQRAEVADLFEAARAEIDADEATLETDTAFGSAAQCIVAYVGENDLDGIVMGHRGRGGPADLRLGSVAELVVRRADVPVTVVR
ncbi:universal stress protein [Natronorubrum tibetense]|uniref:UspA domain-containing protein n=1 Tax=Natronorubrum tibetense GA33 TaxID=1114856 RepID=L9W9E1_9EURY|nr:universal stress protein [Natronorubrum tibetense]ELY45982.1 UspA domain-containing protein [Natronorubrum tibetense GA33]